MCVRVVRNRIQKCQVHFVWLGHNHSTILSSNTLWHLSMQQTARAFASFFVIRFYCQIMLLTSHYLSQELICFVHSLMLGLLPTKGTVEMTSFHAAAEFVHRLIQWHETVQNTLIFATQYYRFCFSGLVFVPPSVVRECSRIKEHDFVLQTFFE